MFVVTWGFVEGDNASKVAFSSPFCKEDRNRICAFIISIKSEIDHMGALLLSLNQFYLLEHKNLCELEVAKLNLLPKENFPPNFEQQTSIRIKTC